MSDYEIIGAKQFRSPSLIPESRGTRQDAILERGLFQRGIVVGVRHFGQPQSATLEWVVDLVPQDIVP